MGGPYMYPPVAAPGNYPPAGVYAPQPGPFPMPGYGPQGYGGDGEICFTILKS